MSSLTSCQGPLAMGVGSIPSVCVVQRKDQSPDEVQLLRELGEG